MSAQINRCYASYNTLNIMINGIADLFRMLDYGPRHIIPIANGGLIPAAMLTYRLRQTGCPVDLIPEVRCSSYDSGGKQSEIRSVWPHDWDPDQMDDPSTLFVDEICDSGATIEHLRRSMPNAKYLALVTKNKVPDYWAQFDDRKHWWVFPWEKE